MEFNDSLMKESSCLASLTYKVLKGPIRPLRRVIRHLMALYCPEWPYKALDVKYILMGGYSNVKSLNCNEN